MTPGGESDASLCAGAAAGDRRAFAALVARHEKRLRAFLGHVAGPDLGDELAQEAFIKAWRHLGAFRGEAQFSSWLCAIGWRCFIDHSRRERSRTRTHEAVADEVPDAGSGLDATLDLAAALARLDPAERAALVLCDGHGWSHTDAAGILRLPLGTLKNMVARAKRKCRAMLAEDDA